MYSKELEEWINVVLADGIITEKKREVIHNRAKIEGVDPDEIDMYIDGKIISLKNQRSQFSSADVDEKIQSDDHINIQVNNKTAINTSVLGWLISIIVVVILTYYLHDILYKTGFGIYSFILGAIVGVVLYRKLYKHE